MAFSALIGGVSIISFATVIGAPVGITTKSLSLVFSISNGIAKKLLKTTRKKNRNNKIVISKKLSSIGNIISKALTDNEISHDEFTTIKE